MDKNPDISLPKYGADHKFLIPQRAVLCQEDMKTWDKSEAYFDYMNFITVLNDEIHGKSCSGHYHKSLLTDNLLSLLDTLDDWISAIPPINQPQRFGNKAFKTWYQKLQEEANGLLVEALPREQHRAIPELKDYLIEAFGNATRIDYGTGHEMSFCMFLCCLFKLGAFTSQDKPAVALYLFPKYLNVVRRLQTVYKMEPAGSRGVWALDDFQFVPFIWGSSQLANHPRIEPRNFTDPEILLQFSSDYMYLACIKFISEVKTGPFAEHSNQLWNISGVASWSKINSGLMKMYKGEVLSKFPVIQHVLFGSILRFVPVRGHAQSQVPLPLVGLRNKPVVIAPPPLIATPSSSHDSEVRSAEIDE